jgi:subtilisin family serine protease
MCRQPLLSAQANDSTRLFTDGTHDMADDTRVTRTRRGLGRATTLALVVAAACASPAFASLRGSYGVAADDTADQWALSNDQDVDLNAPEAWTLSTGAGVTVAIVDTGVDLDHPDLAGRIRSDGYDYIDGDTTPQDLNGHGTEMAGEVAANRNGTGVTGLAPSASILPLRVADANGRVRNNGDIESAYDRAASLGARIVSFSITSRPVTDASLARATAAEWDAVFARHPETLYVVPAGNNSSDDDVAPVYPCDADADNVICVGAHNEDDRIASFSNWGADSVDLFAPGDGIRSTFNDNGDRTESGTSYAAPLVAAEGALLLSRVPSLSAAAVKDLILSTAHRTDFYGPKSVAGGRADAYAALQEAVRDTDHDGVQDVIDQCPTVAANTPDGCAPVPATPTPTATPAPPVVSAPPAGGGSPPSGPAPPAGAPAPTAPRLVSFVATVAHQTATVKVRPDRVARVTLRVERRVCKGGRCRWSRVLVKAITASTRGAKLRTHRLKRGTYRVTARLAGATRPSTRTFRVR